MSDILLTSNEITAILKSHLKIESKIMSIDSIFNNERMVKRINYKPYFQRNYVWDNHKGTYFIESILLGTEIPPLVFFNNGKTIDIIDGRQRYETIKKFIDKDNFVLTKKGLCVLEHLNGQHIDDLDEDVKNIFIYTKLRILEFSIVNEPHLTERQEDLIKKEIFRRYNSGITPLKNVEIERAIYFKDELTEGLKRKFKTDKGIYAALKEMFLSERDRQSIKERLVLDKILSKIRQLIVLHKIPIKKFSALSDRSDILAKFYEGLYDSIPEEDFNEFYKKFKFKIEFMLKILEKLKLLNKTLAHNMLIYECTFWALSILDIEGAENAKINSETIIEEFVFKLIENEDKFIEQGSHFAKNVNERYRVVSNFIEEKFDINTKIYVDDYSIFKVEIVDLWKEKSKMTEMEKLEQFRLKKPEPSTMTIDDICRLMNREKFLVRPPYQRDEVINKIKSSALIESIVLGIQLPPIFLFKRIDGVYEVVDGQQRLLSILGFLGREFINEEGKRVKSNKNKFKLIELKVMHDELKDKNYDDIDQKYKDKILDFNLSVVEIDAKLNSNFDSIDLFIRLNNKPYPIRENSFEMWNSYIDKDIVTKLKETTHLYDDWFYLNKPDHNSRMGNEELFTAVSYFEYRKSKGDGINVFLDTYQKNENINTRIRSKREITKVLNDASISKDTCEKELFLGCIKSASLFLEKVKTLLKELPNDKISYDLNQLCDLKTHSKRTNQNFYSLWIILNDLDMKTIEEKKGSIRDDVKSIFSAMKNSTTDISCYKKILSDFKFKYKDKKFL